MNNRPVQGSNWQNAPTTGQRDSPIRRYQVMGRAGITNRLYDKRDRSDGWNGSNLAKGAVQKCTWSWASRVLHNAPTA